MKKVTYTGKSFSEALILAPVNPQYDERLFIEFQEKYKFTTCCVQTGSRMRASDIDLPVMESTIYIPISYLIF